MRAIAIYACKAEDSSELSFKPGDFINKVQKDEEEGWYSGELDGRRGLFPGNYVRFEEDPPGPPITNIAHILANLPAAPERPPKLDAQETRRRLIEKSNSIVTSGSARYASNGITSTQSMFEVHGQSQGLVQAPQIPYRPAEVGSIVDLTKKKKPPAPPPKNRESLIEQASKKSPPPSPPSGRSSSFSSGLHNSRLSMNVSNSSNTQSLLQTFEGMNTNTGTTGLANNSQREAQPRGSHVSRPVTSFSAHSIPTASQQQIPMMQQSAFSQPVLSNGAQQIGVVPGRQSFVQHPTYGSSGQMQQQIFSNQHQQNIPYQGYQSFSNNQNSMPLQNYNGGYNQNQGNFAPQQNMPYNPIQQQNFSLQRNLNQGYSLQQPLIPTTGFNQAQSIPQTQFSTQTQPVLFNDREMKADPRAVPIGPLPIFDRLSTFENKKQPPQIPTRPSSSTKPVSIFDKLNEKPNPPALPANRPLPSETVRSTSLSGAALPPRPVQAPIKEAIPRYIQLFKQHDRRSSGMLSSTVVKNIWTRSQIDFKLLGKIW